MSASLFQLVNMCSNDGQRMFEAAAVGSLLAGGPLVAVLGVAYNLFILGPTSLLGSAVFILFYPTMVSNCPDAFRTEPHHIQCDVTSCTGFGFNCELLLLYFL